MVDQPARKSLAFYRNRMFITVFVRPLLFFSWTTFVYSTPTYKTNFRPVFCIVIVTTCKSSKRSFSFMFANYNLGYLFLSSSTYTGCPRRNVTDFWRVFLMLKCTDKTRNTYVQIWTVTEIMAREFWNFDSCYTLVNYQIHIKTGRNMWFL